MLLNLSSKPHEQCKFIHDILSKWALYTQETNCAGKYLLTVSIMVEFCFNYKKHVLCLTQKRIYVQVYILSKRALVNSFVSPVLNS